ncbi:integrase [Actinoplanes lutulentus]|uniref:Site-specific recombinase XerD n=1 Tax=Actinoplanes lutulentus TaxID=1287878 RepID=A0A327ZHB2_9ACTN|nr:tyrosine-type recombinase/integrase [Actinoplanes lutulentus]MBB2945333.1 integrase [Actinoplanes lutulentus]RAK40532.1 site-specific recombinase XerD [Actinoplanes lutulentus]
MRSYQVRIWDIGKRTIRSKLWYRVRWSVEGAARPFEELFAKKALANSFRSELVKAANDGQPFDTETGRPMSEIRALNAVTWYVHVREYMKAKWPRLAAKSRRGTVEALTDVTAMLTAKSRRGRPDKQVLREALYRYALNPMRWDEEVPETHAAALAWLERSSILVTELETAATVRRVLDGLCIRQDGTAAAASTISRKRAIFYNAVGYAVELGRLDANPIDPLQWTAPQVASAVDRRVVANPTQVSSLLDALESLGKRADRVRAFFGCLYYAGTRPSEAADIRQPDCELPGRCLDCDTDLPDVTAPPRGSCQHEKIEYGWGRITLAETAPRSGTAWTDDGKPHERRGLKHRARHDTRVVAAPPQLVALLHHHITEYGAAPDGRLFRGLHGGPLSESVYDRWWKMARRAVFTPHQVASPLAKRPYDLRHAAASLWLNAGVPATEVARRLGHSVAVLLRVYANCIDGGEDGVNDRIHNALR